MTDLFCQENVKYLGLHVRLQRNLNLLDIFSFKKSPILNLKEIHPAGAAVTHVERRTDEHDEPKRRLSRL
jgi:hypothetical protein